MRMSDYEIFLKEQDLLIRAGHGHQVRLNLKKLLHKKKAPRQYRGQIAQLARRVGLYYTTLRILHSIVRPIKKSDVPATDTEKLQYAAALIAVGATSEAQSWLLQINEAIEPQVLLYQAINCFTTWSYEQALPYLEKYINTKIDDYQKLMGQINLASALVATRNFEKALQLCKVIGDETKTKKMVLLNAYSLEIRSEAELWLGQHKNCEATLARAEKALAKSGVKAAIWLKKWKAISLLFNHKLKKGFQLLAETRKQAFTDSDWETLRECDLFQSLFSKDENLFCQVYFGTPFLSYRERIQDIFADQNIFYTVPDNYLLKLKTHSINNEHTPTGKTDTDTHAFEIDPTAMNSQSVLKPGQLEHRLLCTLTEDFYRPYRLAHLHECLYPQQYFNPITSPRKIHELVRRARAPLNDLGLTIESHKSGYKLTATKNILLKVHAKNSPPVAREHYLWREFKSKINKVMFKRHDLENVLGLSTRSAQRIINWAINENLITSEGHGKAISYSMKS